MDDAPNILQSHISTIDKDGMAISMTTTVNLVFGSQLLDPETGIIFNDEVMWLMDFDQYVLTG